MQQLLNIFRCNPSFSYKPSGPTVRPMLSKFLKESGTLPWDEIDLSDKIGHSPSLAKRRQYILIRSDLTAAIKKLITKHPVVTDPSCVSYIDDNGHVERLIQEFYSGDLHINTTRAIRIHLQNNSVAVIMVKLWSDVTCLGGNDRLPVRLFMLSLGNHPMAFSKSDEGQICVAMCNEAVKDHAGKW